MLGEGSIWGRFPLTYPHTMYACEKLLQGCIKFAANMQTIEERSHAVALPPRSVHRICSILFHRHQRPMTQPTNSASPPIQLCICELTMSCARKLYSTWRETAALPIGLQVEGLWPSSCQPTVIRFGGNFVPRTKVLL